MAEVVRSVLDSLAPMDTLDVGCGTGYVSGWLPGRALPYLIPVQPCSHVVPALLADHDLRERHGGDVNWDRAERMVSFGGIRIEDNVLVTTDGYEVLTSNVPLIG